MSMRPRWRKVFSDLVDNKLRTLLVIVSIAVGVISVGVIAGAYVMIENDMSASYAANNPSNIELRTDFFDANFLDTIDNMDGVAQAEGRFVLPLRVQARPDSPWVILDIMAVDDVYSGMINELNLMDGKRAPDKREIVLEESALEELDLQIGDPITVQLLDGATKTLTVVGIVQDTTTSTADFLAPPMGFVNSDSLSYLRLPAGYNRLLATVSENKNDVTHIRQVMNTLSDKFEKSGRAVFRTRVSLTNEHPLASTVNAILGILLALGVLIVFLSSSLIANTLSALLNQHLRHIGVMKLIGGRNRQIFQMYLALILAFGVLALLISIPIGGQGAYALAQFIASELGFNLLGYRVIPLSIIIQVMVGLAVPLIAGFIPVINGSRVTVLRAISGEAAEETQSSDEPGQIKSASRFERFQLRVDAAMRKRGWHLPRPLLISLRNTFRRRGRLLLTLFTLTMGGAIFIAVFNVRVTLHEYINEVGKYFLADVTLDFEKSYRIREVEQFALQVPGVVAVEGWAFASAEVLDNAGEAVDNLLILAPPADSPLITPNLVAGRWIQAGDRRQMAVSEAIFSHYPNLKAGESIQVKFDGKQETWQVVGIFKFVDQEEVLAYAPYEYIAERLNTKGRSFSYRIVTDRHDRAYQEMMSERLDIFLRDRGFAVREASPGLASLEAASENLDTLVTFLLIMALLTAVVGSMGLTGTMGMNVLERTREIGIMRAIGAVDTAIMRMIITEGVLIGTISFILAILLSFPFTVLLSTIVSLAVFATPIKLVFTLTGYVIWFALVLVLSALASILPARNAARLTIREVLAYE